MSGASLLAWRLASAVAKPGGGSHARVEVKRGDDAIFGDGPYPRKLSEFVGQEQAKEQLMTGILSATTRNVPLPHVLLASGYPGIGKTTLGKIVASILSVGYVELGGQVKEKDVQAAVESMKPHDVLFLDEVHRLVAFGKRNAEWLLQLLQDGVLVLPTGVVKVPPITIIAATTDAQKLPQTILDRFTIQPLLEAYSDVEAVDIAKVTAKRMGISLPEGQFHRVAAAADCNPRVIGRLLSTVRDIQVGQPNVTDPVMLAMKWTGISPDGLNRSAQDYLMLLMGYGGLAAQSTIKAALNESDVSHTERVLIQRGFIQITGKGRELTKLGSDRAQELLIENTPEDK